MLDKDHKLQIEILLCLTSYQSNLLVISDLTWTEDTSVYQNNSCGIEQA